MAEPSDPEDVRAQAAVQVGEPHDPDDTDSTDGTSDTGDTGDTDEEHAERLAREVGAENPDPTTRREAIEQALAGEASPTRARSSASTTTD